MKNSKKIVTLFLISALTMSSSMSVFADEAKEFAETSADTSYSEKVTEVQPVTSVKMKSVSYMTVGSVTEMSSTLTVSPETATNKEMVWESSNKEIAVVDELGCVQAVKTGRCVITARSKENSDKKKSESESDSGSGSGSDNGNSSSDSDDSDES